MSPQIISDIRKKIAMHTQSVNQLETTFSTDKNERLYQLGVRVAMDAVGEIFLHI